MQRNEVLSGMQPRSCTNVYVANLPPSVDSVAVKAFFSSVGDVLHVKLLRDIATGESRGVAFVKFKDPETAKRACDHKNRVMFHGHTIQVRFAERGALHSAENSHVESNIVYVRNVPGAITADEVRLFCESRNWHVKSVSFHPQSRGNLGPSPYNMVFVEFFSVADAEKCVDSLDGKAPFPLPYAGHPLVMAKMVSDVESEQRKSILIRPRGSLQHSQQTNVPPSPNFPPAASAFEPIIVPLPPQPQPQTYQLQPMAFSGFSTGQMVVAAPPPQRLEPQGTPAAVKQLHLAAPGSEYLPSQIIPSAFVVPVAQPLLSMGENFIASVPAATLNVPRAISYDPAIQFATHLPQLQAQGIAAPPQNIQMNFNPQTPTQPQQIFYY